MPKPRASAYGGTVMAGNKPLFVGSLNREAPYFQGARGKGISVFSFDPTSGASSFLSETAGIDNPSFIAVHPSNGCVYAVSEVFGWNEGVVSAYRFDAGKGRLVYLNKQPTLGSITAHASFDRTGRYLLVANYAIGEPDELPGKAVAVFPIRADGGLGPAVSSVAHAGSGPNASRQERPHAHCIFATPDNRFAIVADLGIDKVVAHRFDAASGELSPGRETSLAPGAGPRHFVFHPSGRFAFVINELDSTIAALAFDPATGGFTLLDTVSALPGISGLESHCSSLQITPDGRFLTGANRGHDSIVTYAVDQATGKLRFVGFTPTGGKTPRDHTVDPSGRWLLVCNQNSDRITVFRIDPESGALTDSGHPIETGTPMCAKFAP